jgi:hypothetical protein
MKTPKKVSEPKIAAETTGTRTIPPKQAVVIIHGIGEQRPMETLRSFVRAVWQTDPGIIESDGPGPYEGPQKRLDKAKPRGAPKPAGEPERAVEEQLFPTVAGQYVNGSKLRKAWMIPDTKTGSNELARMATAMTNDGYRVDFFELYWADIMQGTTWSHLKAWIFGLLLRWPHQVPRDVLALWIWLWVTALALVAIALAAAPALASMLGFGDIFNNIDLLPRWAKSLLDESLGEIWASGWTDFLRHVFWIGVMLTAVVAMDRVVKNARRQNSRARSTGAPVWSETAIVFTGLAVLAIGIAVTWVGLSYAPLLLKMTVRGVLSTVAVAVIFLINAIVVPYFGDVARYVQASPENIAQRAAVRERGVKLLRALHDVDESGVPIKDRKPNYGRVILVGHSLGSIIAYDILLEFWAQAGPLRTPISGDIAERVADIERVLTDGVARPRDPAWLANFRHLQKELMKAMRAASEPFRITDFVTVGSPLTHAEFLVTSNLLRFRQLIENRLLSLCPPYPYEQGRDRIVYEAKDDDGKTVRHFHHAAPFAAVRWTNIFDKRRLILFGDLISGPLRENFGEGIADRRVRIEKPGLLKRFFTHTKYWDTSSSGTEVALDGSELDGEKLTHVGLLRRAIAFNEYKGFYPAQAEQRRETHYAAAQDTGKTSAA